MDDTISDMDIELEQKDNKIQFLQDKVGIPDSKFVEEEMNRLDLNKISSKDRFDRIMNRFKKHLLIVNICKIKSHKTIIFKEKICFENYLSIETIS